MTETEPNLPQFDLRSVLLFFWRNLRVLKRHWLLFMVAVVSAAVLAGYTVRQLDTRQIDILTADNIHLRDRNTALAQNAGASPPSEWRRLSDGQRAALIHALKQWAAKPKELSVFAMAESESRQYAGQFLDVLRAVGIEPKPNEFPMSGWGGPVSPGLMVGVINFDDPPPEARAFLQLIKDAGLDVQFTIWSGTGKENPTYDLFVGPKPW